MKEDLNNIFYCQRLKSLNLKKKTVCYQLTLYQFFKENVFTFMDCFSITELSLLQNFIKDLHEGIVAEIYLSIR
jgi:hypothetical protein